MRWTRSSSSQRPRGRRPTSRPRGQSRVRPRYAGTGGDGGSDDSDDDEENNDDGSSASASTLDLLEKLADDQTNNILRRCLAFLIPPGDEIEVDTIVLGTGFHVTDSPMMARFRNAEGHSITEVCDKNRLGAYNGTVIPTFPNLFVIPGPNTGIGHTSLIVMIEAQVGWCLQLLDAMDRRGLASIEVRQRVHDEWCDLMDAKTEPTVWNSGCSSWYLDKDGRNSTLWPGLTTEFRKRLRTVDLSKFETTRRRATPVGD